MSHKAKMKCTKRVANMLNMICLRPFSCNSFWLIEEKVPHSHWDRCLRMPHTPVPVTASSDRFDQLMEKSEERRGSIDFSREIAEARAILSKANF